MGNAIQNLSRRVVRPLKNFNVDNRAERVLTPKENIVRAAPKHPSVASKIEEFAKNHPELLDTQKTKPTDLLERLKVVSVSSSDETDPNEQQENNQRALPQDRVEPPIFELGLKEPEHVPIGKVSLKDALFFISNHQRDPNEWTAEYIATKHKLGVENTRNILKYFQVLQIHVSETPKQPKLADNIKNFLTPK